MAFHKLTRSQRLMAIIVISFSFFVAELSSRRSCKHRERFVTSNNHVLYEQLDSRPARLLLWPMPSIMFDTITLTLASKNWLTS
jgi:hypothetical protein